MLRQGRPFLLLVLTATLAALLFLGLAGIAGASGVTGRETPLNPDGLSYEVSADRLGHLWVSDYGANQIWQIAPASGVYTIYNDMWSASDARMDAAGAVWWNNAFPGGTLGRINLANSTVTTWTLPPSASVLGLAFDGSGHIWATDIFSSTVYRFTPGTRQLCAYPLPDAGASDYILAQGNNVWLGDRWNSRIVKLDPTGGAFTLWQLSPFAAPEGLALAANGDIWWADSELGRLGRLEPGLGHTSSYTLPQGAIPNMVTYDLGRIWYTETMSGTVGVLDPQLAAHLVETPVATTVATSPDCSTLDAVTTPLSQTVGSTAWIPTPLSLVANAGGWHTYQLPDGALPWGVTTSRGSIWAVDRGRSMLVALSSGSLYLPTLTRR